MPLVPVNWSDPRLIPGALITDGKRLLEVQHAGGLQGSVIILDCRNDLRTQVRAWDIVHGWELVREAPAAPDTLEVA